MSAPMFVLDRAGARAAQVGDVITLTGPEGRHAVSVARMGAGERIDLGDGAGRVLASIVEQVEGSDRLMARVLHVQDLPPSRPHVVVVQALPKGDRGEAAVQTLTEVGVDEIVPWAAERCIARWVGDRAVRGREKWAAAAHSAGKQARRARFPVVAKVADTSAVETRVRRAVTALVLQEDARQRLHGVNMPAEGEILLIVGPEGGVSPAELTRFSEAGAVPVRMGPSVLRTSTAGTVAAGIVLSRTARWS